MVGEFYHSNNINEVQILRLISVQFFVYDKHIGV